MLHTRTGRQFFAPELTRALLARAQSAVTAAGLWEELTAAGGEGMVVKPAANLSRGPRGVFAVLALESEPVDPRL